MHKKAKVNGELKDVTSVSFRCMDENPNEYSLVDGTTIKVKTIVQDIARIDGEFTPDGMPNYVIKSGVQMTVTSCSMEMTKDGKGVIM